MVAISKNEAQTNHLHEIFKFKGGGGFDYLEQTLYYVQLIETAFNYFSPFIYTKESVTNLFYLGIK